MSKSWREGELEGDKELEGEGVLERGSWSEEEREIDRGAGE